MPKKRGAQYKVVKHNLARWFIKKHEPNRQLPEIILADEPVSALDVSIQAQIINLMMDLQEEFNLSIIFIAHDLSVVKHISDRIGVMYNGELVEINNTDDIFDDPRDDYTKELLRAIPQPDPSGREERKRDRLGIE